MNYLQNGIEPNVSGERGFRTDSAVKILSAECEASSKQLLTRKWLTSFSSVQEKNFFLGLLSTHQLTDLQTLSNGVFDNFKDLIQILMKPGYGKMKALSPCFHPSNSYSSW